MTEKKPSYSRLAGKVLVATYVACAFHTVIWLGLPMPDIPPMLGTVICGIYGINRFSGNGKADKERKTDET